MPWVDGGVVFIPEADFEALREEKFTYSEMGAFVQSLMSKYPVPLTANTDFDLKAEIKKWEDQHEDYPKVPKKEETSEPEDDEKEDPKKDNTPPSGNNTEGKHGKSE